MSRPRADVGGQQYILQFGEQLGIDLLLARDEVFDPGYDLRPRLRDRLFQPFEQRWFALFFVLLKYGKHIFATIPRAGPFILAEEHSTARGAAEPYPNLASAAEAASGRYRHGRAEEAEGGK
jgi:hypothetical protein